MSVIGKLSPMGEDEELQRIEFSCPYCKAEVKTVVFPWTPRIAKFDCRNCSTTIEVRTRDSAMDDVEGHIEEGEHQLKMSKRKSFIIGSPGRPDRRKLVARPTRTKQMGGAMLLDLE